ncbi:catabolite repression HPr-like protein/phosphocarrier protein [Evansella caseinilytica]|uniref:Catabolite repression HPr-like protein/phosphocarrier protein n=1 Tax=Evansella caseinilytica TaxID=1503961 RepID=A0A1H3I278_9BACI|nr:HPr family phosphocarrier protein [Evansella caseinilytica]SDY21796.1 catabolite repression HPr-like protein/phosphocarrier protein [Evansella caseinilytica]
MLVKKLTVQLPRGLQAKHTTLFIRQAFTFQSEIVLGKHGKTTSGTDLMGIMDLAVEEGDEVILMTDGIDEQVANQMLENFLVNGYIFKEEVKDVMGSLKG